MRAGVHSVCRGQLGARDACVLVASRGALSLCSAACCSATAGERERQEGADEMLPYGVRVRLDADARAD